MAKTCLTCGKRAYSDYCVQHKPRKPIQSRSVKPKALKVKTSKPKTKKRSWYVKELDKVFSLYIRQSKPPICVTCGKRDEPKNLQNGHYYSRGKLPTRWNEDNCWPQCVGCNVFKSGNYTEYALFMLQTLGEDKMRELHQIANSAEKIPTSVIKEKIEEYTAKLLTY